MNKMLMQAPLALLVVAAAAVLDVSAALAASEKILYSFGNAPAAVVEPRGGVIADNKGNLYGTTVGGGNYKKGMVYELSPSHNRTRWTEHVLWSFGGIGDGIYPYGELIADNLGNLYGTTSGENPADCKSRGATPDCGTVFELSPPASQGAQWSERVLWIFGATGDGQLPYQGLIADGAGNLYGMTKYGGTRDLGTAFELSPPAGQSTQWGERVLWSFGSKNDGRDPEAALLLDAAGNLFGTTFIGSNASLGTVFELSPPAGQSTQWSEQVLWNFGIVSGDGYFPTCTLIADKAGNLYGVTGVGGATNSAYSGTVFELSPPTGQSTQWSEQVLWDFGIVSGDGTGPDGGLLADAAGNLYGITFSGGLYGDSLDGGSGTAFELSSPNGQNTQWSEQVLWDFGGSGDGRFPIGDLIADNLGNLYGTTWYGGANAYDGGTVYEITLP